jgi:hypothetical protein
LSPQPFQAEQVVLSLIILDSYSSNLKQHNSIDLQFCTTFYPKLEILNNALEILELQSEN